MKHQAKIIITVIDDEGHVDTATDIKGEMTALMMFNTLLALAAAFNDVVGGTYENVRSDVKVIKP